LKYEKPFLTFDEQVQLLQSRGLIIADPGFAREVLASVNYYRFSGYAIPFMTSREQFKNGVQFETIVQAMRLDEQLRDHLAAALETLEINFRTTFAHEHSRIHQALGYTDQQCFNFENRNEFAELMQRVNDEISKSKERCIPHLMEKYGVVPVWAMVEVVSFGIIVRMYRNMDKRDQLQIARRYAIVDKILGSYMQHLLVLRNMCAHHARLWDKEFFGIIPLNNWRKAKLPLHKNRRVFFSILLLYRLTRHVPEKIFNRDVWKQKTLALLNNFQKLPHCAPFEIMGIPENGFDDVWWE